MAIRVFDTLRRAKEYCKKMNKHARKYTYNWQKKPKGGFFVYKYHNANPRKKR